MRIQGYNRINTPKLLETLNVTVTEDTQIPQPTGGAVYGFDEVNITVPTDNIIISQNGTYTAPNTIAGYKVVTVNVSSGGSTNDTFIQIPKAITGNLKIEKMGDPDSDSSICIPACTYGKIKFLIEEYIYDE